jgi:hypothetical protein
MRDGHNTESWRLSIIIADYSGAAQRAAAVRSRRSRVVVAPIAGRPRGCYHRGDACRQEGGVDARNAIQCDRGFTSKLCLYGWLRGALFFTLAVQAEALANSTCQHFIIARLERPE